ncbi:MAG: trigger factor [Lachnospiraceae bacterium]|nr:trigger factor [Lachnospiraceae bacterium]
MRKFTKLCLCTVAAAALAAGCGKKDVQETTVAETTAAQTQEEVPEGKVTLGEYKGLEIAEVDTTVTDEQVENQISYVLDSNPEEVEVTDRAAEEGDVVNIDYVGMKDGEAFAGGTAEGYDLELGSGTFIDGFEDGLIGANVGDELSLNLTFPENYSSTELAGQDVVFDVTVNAIKEKKDAVLDDAFVQRISQTSKTVEEYRAEIRTMLEENARESAEYQKQSDVMDQVIAASSFEGLDAQVDAELEQQLAQMQLALDQSSMSLSDYASMFGMDEDGFKDYMRLDIENSIKISLVTKEIAAQENLEVDDDARMDVAAIYGLDSPDELVQTYGQEALDEAARNIMVMNFLVENAKIVEE